MTAAAAVMLALSGHAAPPSIEQLYRESHALVIAASDYRQWRDLPGARSDAQEVANVLKRHGFTVRVLTDPTHSELDAGLRDFARDFGQRPDARLLFYFAGHGYTLTTADGRQLGYIVPVDAPRPEGGHSEFKRYAMSMNEIEVMAQELESRHVLFVFDSCFSGSVFNIMRGTPPPIIGEKLSRPVREFISAGTAEQPVPDNGLFRRQFVEALEGEADYNHDGFITGNELGSFLETQVTNYSRGTQTPQFGRIRHPELDKGDIVFRVPPIRSKSAAPGSIEQRPPAHHPSKITITDERGQSVEALVRVAQRLQLKGYATEAELREESEKSAEVAGMITVHMTLDVTVRQPGGTIATAFVVASRGGGFRQDAARAQALERLAAAFDERLAQEVP